MDPNTSLVSNLEFKLAQKNVLCLVYIPGTLKRMTKARTSYRLFPCIAKDRY